MKKQRGRRTIKIENLENLVKDENSCICIKRKDTHLVLHPYHLTNINNSVREILDKKIAKYCPRLEGILCGYKNVKFLSEIGRILDDVVYVHVDVEADFYVFKPTPERLLEGVVSKISKDHVGCLVHGIFNVSLPKPKRAENWIGHSLSPRSKITVRIDFTNFDGKLPYIRGDIVSLADAVDVENVETEFEQEENEENTSDEDT